MNIDDPADGRREYNMKGQWIMEKKDFEQNVVVAVFGVESEGFQALSEMRQQAVADTYMVSAAALVKKTGDACFYLDGFDTGAHTQNDAVIGGLIGMVVGIIGGPLGVLLGGSYGGDAVFGASMLDQIADKLDDGMVALVALAAEETTDALDTVLSAYDTVIARFDAEAVAEEVDRAYEKQSEMARQAKMELRKQQKEETKKQLEENEEILRHNFTK